MKQPTQEQLIQLQSLRNHRHVVEYLESVENDYLKNMVTQQDVVKLRQCQGTVYAIRELLKLILTK